MTVTEIKVKEIVEPIITSLGYELYDVIYEKEGSENYLRIFIDKESGISIVDCENVNNAITDILDEKDVIKNQYMLEVSSCGLERRLRSDDQLEKVINKKIEVHTFKSVTEEKKEKIYIGLLISFDDKSITINVENKETELIIEKENIAKMQTVYNWEEK